MKRILALMVLLSAITMTTQAQLVKFGIKGGLDLVSMSFNESVFDTSNKAGWFVGPTVQVNLLAGLGADIAAFYDQKTAEVNSETIKMKSILVPLNVRYKFGLGKTVGIYVAAGPQFGFNVGDSEFKWTDKSSYENTFQLKKSNFSINLGAGVYLTKHLEVGFAYNIAMGKTADASWKQAWDATVSTVKNDDTKTKSWQISAAYFF
jgi:opacity protein-like surface antigen